ncbi:MAG: gamma-glutamyltransferase [Gammaproteobacteria bacterium]|nr:gamma-glutamyltransferase [Gammaproteobacteria bacterium]HAH67137.1 gamma-glutamyltransferase [Gammaproteobacteria bacterium]
MAKILKLLIVINLAFFFGESIHAEGFNKAGIATAHPLATKAGYEILEMGGNAFDAAVTVSAVLSVVEPYSSGLGGGGFFLLHNAEDGQSVFVDAREKAPSMADRDMYLDENGDVLRTASLNGPLASGIPGLPAALHHVANNHGSMPLYKLLEPAIRLARDGFPAYERLITALNVAKKSRTLSPKFKAVFMPNDQLPEVGQLIKQPELAKTLEIIASNGHDSFYSSFFTQKMIDEARQDGSIWLADDFKNYSVVEREPIKVNFLGAQLTTAPPPSSGGTTIATILNIISEFDFIQMDISTRTHLVVESMRRAYRDRAFFLGDPDFVDVPIKKLTSKEHASILAQSIDMNAATPIHEDDQLDEKYAWNEGSHTTHFSILDMDGNRAAVTQTINTWFGSGYMLPSSGLILNNEMDDFSAKPFAPNRYGLVHGEQNSIQPNKRMLSSMTPTFIESEKGLAILGTPGGARIITMVLLSILDYFEGGSAETMTATKRFHHQFLPDVIRYEKDAFTEETIKILESKGHTLQEISSYGNMQVVTWEKDSGDVNSSSDPRGIIEGYDIDFY